ncbi:hypothetical protein [Moorena sp. SIO4A5]|uniref:hypothetical protein n=1 Tax=Moorena sp. SIO4A5 TaxID=2607838 RepID=UPI0025D504DC|nr:hypothetical protein [Moorena sp. SIO4A5]
MAGGESYVDLGFRESGVGSRESGVGSRESGGLGRWGDGESDEQIHQDNDKKSI